MEDKLLILYLEDDLRDIQLVESELMARGLDHKLIKVQSLDQLSSALESAQPDIILSDYKLKESDYLSALKAVKLKGIGAPFILVSDPMGEELAAEAIRRGVSDIVLKRRIHLLVPAIERALRERGAQVINSAESVFRALVEQSLAGIYLIQGNRFVYVNPKLAEIFGYAQQEMLSLNSILEVVAEEDRPLVAEKIRERLLGRTQTAHYSFRGRRKDGSQILVEVQGGRTEFQGRPAILGVLLDITERQRAQEALRESEQKYRELVERINDAIYAVDENGIITYMSPAAEQMTGYTVDELVGHHFSEFIYDEDLPGLQESFRRSLSGISEPYEYRIRTKDGRIRWVRSHGRSILSEGKLSGLRGVLSDITDRKRAEEAMRLAEERHRQLIQNAVYGIYRSSLDGKFLEVNPALVQMLGYGSAEELLAVDMATDIYLDPDERHHLIEQYRQAGRIEGIEVKWKRKDGSPITVRLSGRTLHDERGKLEGFEMIVEDVTERRLLEEQLRQAQKMEAIGQLAGGIAHDFNNLLTAVMGYAEVLLRRLDPASDLYQFANQIKDASEQAASLIKQLLAFSRKQLLQPKVVDLNQLITNSANMLSRLIGEDIEMDLILDPSLGKVKADPVQIEQVIMNLAVNARDAMPQGGKLTLETRNVYLDEDYARRHLGVRPGHYILLAMSDTGIGMDQETLSHIFEPFFTTKEKGKGTGLGLSTVYGIVKQSGGNIWVYSELGRGTTFKIYLPRVEGEADPIEIKLGPDADRTGSETILLVEDDAAVRHLAKEILQMHGYTVLEAPGGEEALQLIEGYSGHIHLMLTDVVMPRMSGPELAARAAPLRPQMKVLYMSGYSENAIAHHGILHPGTHFLPKPFTPEALALKVREVLDS
jgi:two-component system cell cycle sensor histidine kinase/response regulator CckA